MSHPQTGLEPEACTFKAEYRPEILTTTYGKKSLVVRLGMGFKEALRLQANSNTFETTNPYVWLHLYYERDGKRFR